MKTVNAFKNPIALPIIILIIMSALVNASHKHQRDVSPTSVLIIIGAKIHALANATQMLTSLPKMQITPLPPGMVSLAAGMLLKTQQTLAPT